MNKNTEILLNKLKINNKELFEKVILYKAKYISEANSGDFYFHLENKFAKVFDTLKEASVKLNLNFTYKLAISDQNIQINDQIKAVVFDAIILKSNTNFKYLNLDNIEVDSKHKIISINVEDNSIYYSICKKYQLIYLLMEAFSWDYKIEINHNENTDTLITKEISIIDRERCSKKTSIIKNTDSNKYKYVKINDIYLIENKENNFYSVRGKIFKKIARQTKTKTGNNLYIITYYITDFENSIVCTMFAFTKNQHDYFNRFEEGNWVIVNGVKKFNNYLNTYHLKIDNINPLNNVEKDKIFSYFDDSSERRIELNCHTKMSTMDGCSQASNYIKYAALELKHQSVGISDINNVQSFPSSYKALQEVCKINSNFKLIYGCEFYVVDDCIKFIINNQDIDLRKDSIVSFDLETTGLYANLNDIIEIAAVKVNSNGVEEKFQTLIKIDKKIPLHIQKITSITNDMLQNSGIKLNVALQNFKKFVGNSLIIAHNLSFDYSFLNAKFKQCNMSIMNNCFLDTLWLSRLLFSSYKSHSLKSISKKNKVKYEDSIAHRALYDSEVLYSVYQKLLNELNKQYPNILNINHLNDLFQKKITSRDKNIIKHLYPFSVLTIVKNAKGMKNLYELVSIANTKNFANRPLLYKKDFEKYRDNLLLVSLFLKSDIFSFFLNQDIGEIQSLISFYDYVQLNPVKQYEYLVNDNKINSIKIVEDMMIKLINICKNLNIKCYASAVPFYIYQNQKIIRDIIINSKQIGGKSHYLYNYKDIKRPNPDHSFLNTKDLLKDFAFVNNSELIKQLVIYNTLFINSQIEKNIKPIKHNLYKPVIKSSYNNLHSFIYKTADKMYGENIPNFIKERIVAEFEKITQEGYDIVYWISHLLVEQSNKDGYIVGSRGSVGSSFIAFLANITEVNPLPPHYNCKNCKYTEYAENVADSGYDLPNKNCPKCNKKLYGDGQNIPFETFLGFSGEKIPDIDLNFAAVYQNTAHNYCKELFGKEHIFRAGTISTIQSRTAYGIVKKFLEERVIVKNQAEIERLCNMIQGVKKTTGQHPGGIIVVPKHKSILDFTPYNYPADDTSSDWYTTHFDFNAIHDNLLKLDLLGHLDPEILKSLEKLTGIDPISIPFTDPNVLNLYQNNEFLKDKCSESLVKTGTLGVPEFGTNFVMKILGDANPKNFADLIRICGLAHGTNVWLNNSRELIKDAKMQLKDLITCRDDIMNFLVSKGIDEKLSFEIMESVRKGKGINSKYNDILFKHNVEKWYIDSCNAIKYMFPKAHAAAYVINSWRIAWYKLYYPLQFYAVFLSYRAENFNYPLIMQDLNILKMNISDLEQKSIKLLKSIEQDLLYTLKIIYEMKLRGIDLEDIDLYKSDAANFLPLEKSNKILLPFRVVTGLGVETAQSIVRERELKSFVDLKDLKKRTKINKNHTEIFKNFF